MFRTLARVVLAALLALPASQAFAAHYYLQDVEMFDSYADAFATQSFVTTRDVLVAVVTPEQRTALSETTGVPVEELAVIARFLGLLQIDGVGPRAARLLQAAGIAGSTDLAARSPAELLALLETTNAGFVYTSAHPSMHHVQGWIYEAARVEFTVVN